MLAYAILSLVVIAFAQMAASLRSDRWLRLPFVLIFLFLGLRYDYGNDYQNYQQYFGDAHQLERLEPGWQVLCYAFRPLGFFAMVAALAAFNCWIYYRFTKRYVPRVYYGMAVFLYVCNPYFMLLHSSAMRQSLAISLFLHALQYIESRSLVRYVVVIAVAATFHSSAIFLLPAYLLGGGRLRMGVVTAVSVFGAYVLAVAFASELKPYVDRFVSLYAIRYEMYEGGSELGTGLGLIYGAGVLAVILAYARREGGQRSMLFNVAIVGYFATVPLGMVNIIAGRMGMYFNPALIAVVPLVAAAMKDRRVRGIFLGTYACMTLYLLYAFFANDLWGIPFGTYQTIFSAPSVLW